MAFDVNFQFFSLAFVPLKETNLSHRDITKNVLRYLQNERSNGTATLIDRYEGRESKQKRELFMYSIYEMPKENRFRCNLALLRDGIKPKLKPNNTFELKEIKDNGDLVEETHFFVDYSNSVPVVCIEYKYHGARAADIEYYLRQIAHKYLKIAKGTSLKLYMDSPIESVLDSFKNLLKFNIKVKPKNFALIQQNLKIGHYYSSMNKIGTDYKPKYLKVEASFYFPESKEMNTRINRKANNFILDNLKLIKSNNLDMYLFDNFEIEFENNEGDFDTFSLLKGKKEFTKEINLDTIRKNSDWYNLIKIDFDEFMNDL